MRRPLPQYGVAAFALHSSDQIQLKKIALRPFSFESIGGPPPSVILTLSSVSLFLGCSLDILLSVSHFLTAP